VVWLLFIAIENVLLLLISPRIILEVTFEGNNFHSLGIKTNGNESDQITEGGGG